jgi:signal transduction histidine kinase
MEISSRQQGDTTTITVADSGPGIPKDQEERIFEPFHRLSNKVSDGVAGTGIGLSIARDLARKHGGDLRAAASSAGARFQLDLRTPPTKGTS